MSRMVLLFLGLLLSSVFADDTSSPTISPTSTPTVEATDSATETEIAMIVALIIGIGAIGAAFYFAWTRGLFFPVKKSVEKGEESQPLTGGRNV